MSMGPSEIKLELTITEADADEKGIDDITRLLQRDLRELGVESVERSSGGAVPKGAKGDPFTLGALAVAVLPVVLPKLVEFLQAWSLRGGNRTIKIKTADGLELEFTPDRALSYDEMLALVDRLAQKQR